MFALSGVNVVLIHFGFSWAKSFFLYFILQHIYLDTEMPLVKIANVAVLYAAQCIYGFQKIEPQEDSS